MEQGHILADPSLGPRLVAEARGELPYDIWRAYLDLHCCDRKDVLTWDVDLDELATQDPQKTIDEVAELIFRVIHLLPDSPRQARAVAVDAAERLWLEQRDCTHPEAPQKLQHIACRAFVIRKFNPNPKRPEESLVTWHKLADLLLCQGGKCPKCQEENHRYQSRCVHKLQKEVSRLKAQMEHDGIPT